MTIKKFFAKIFVKSKPNVQNVKCLNLKLAIEKLVPVQNLSCQTGMFYMLNFEAQDQREALHMVEKITKSLLYNEAIEEYEIKALEEVYEELG